MISAFANSFKVPELRSRILFTLAMIVIVRIGTQITLPGIDPTVLSQWIADKAENSSSAGAQVAALLNIFSGGGLQNCAIFALGIMPYISASIIFQLMTAVVPALSRLQQEGDVGRQKLTQYTRYATVLICLIQGTLLLLALQNPGQLFSGYSIEQYTGCENKLALNIADIDPGPTLAVEPRSEDAKALSKDRVAPLFRHSPALKGKLSAVKSRDSNNTAMHKVFANGSGHITFTGAISPSGLAMRPIRYLLLDEIDRYPTSAGSEGDPVSLAMQRTGEFEHNKKAIMCSTPTVDGESRIQAAWNTSDQREYFVTARTADDMAFAFTSWGEGIAPWRYNVPTASWTGPYLAHAVLDRSLVRAGETVHMKHVVRRHDAGGLSVPAAKERPALLRISHVGSEEHWDVPLSFNAAGSAWTEHFLRHIARDDWTIAVPEHAGSFMLLYAEPGAPNRLQALANYYASLYSPLVAATT